MRPDDTEPLVEETLDGGGDSPFVYERKQTDTPWGIAYGIFLALAIIGGIYSITHRNPEYHKIDRAYMNNPHNCPLDGSNLLQKHHAEPGSGFNISDFMQHAGTWLILSAVGSLGVGALYLQMFKYAPGAMTRATIAMQIALPLAMGTAGLAAGQWGAGAMGLVLASLAAFVFYLWRNEIVLCAKLLGLSAEALTDNPGIILFVLAAQLVNAIIVIALAAFAMFAYEHGNLVPNPTREGRQQCVDHGGQPVPCCAWQPTPQASTYMGLTAVTLLWTVFLFSQMRTFVISGTVAQWYFSPRDSRARQGTTTRSIKYALGPQFGTIAFAGAILTLVDLARSATDQARQSSRDGGNILMSLLACVLECIYSIIEFLTKFATIFASITGEPLVESGRNVTQLLVRNFLKAVGVWWFPPMVLQMGSLAVSATWGLLLYVCTRFSWAHYDTGKQEAILLGVLAFVMAFIVLSFCSSVLLNIVEALFVCYALDRDRQAVTNPKVHEVYSQLPVGAVIEQPGEGGYAYGRPEAGQGQGRVQYVPPAEQERYPALPP
jgi:hypothetical protein